MWVCFLCTNPTEGAVLDARRSNVHSLPPPCVRLLSSEGFGRIEIALPEGVNVDSEASVELLNEFSIAIVQQTCVTVSTHFECPCP